MPKTMPEQDCTITPNPVCLHRLQELEKKTDALSLQIKELDAYLRNGRLSKIESRLTAVEERIKAVQHEQAEAEEMTKGIQSGLMKLTLLVAGGGGVGGVAAALIVKLLGG